MRRDITGEEYEQYDGLDQITILEELYALKDRIAELERCVVMGGDGKPIAVGDTIHFWSVVWEQSCHCLVESISKDEKGYYINNYPRRLYVKDCYSSPDSVPEGGKE